MTREEEIPLLGERPVTRPNRVDRFLACTAYLDGVHPSLVTARGYYGKAIVVAYDWDGKNLNKRWRCDSTVSGYGSLAGQLTIMFP